MKKQIKKIAAFLLALAVAFTLLPTDAQAASNIRLNKSKVTIYTGGTTTLKVTGTSRKASFSSSNKSVAPVSSSGKITAKKAGTATITAKVGSKKLTCKVTVKKENPKLSKSKTTLYVGSKTTLKVSGTSRKASFSSSNKSVAPVSSSGKITAKKAGTATITAKVGSKKLTCKITVKAKEQANTEITVYWNGEKNIKATGAVGTVTWESSSNSIATIKSTGTATATLTGKKVGRTTITAKISGKTFKKYTVNVKMKTTPLTQKEKDLAFYAQGKYDRFNTMTADSKLRKLGLTNEIDNQSLWNTHNRAVNTARKLLPGRAVYVCDVDSWKGAWDKEEELKRKGMKYAYSATISHDHGKTEKWSVMWIK